ncbi:MAG TPA: DUF3024 domain-containing protein [Holophaga sp.]|nr:DUF3024 domain-containing protein [Holophaga sp.]
MLASGMPIHPDFKRATNKVLEEYCRKKTSATGGRIEVKFSWRGASVTLAERKPWVLEPSGWIEIAVAQFRYSSPDAEWTLYWADRNSRWHPYDDLSSAPDLGTLLAEVDEDPTGIFWG